LAELLEREAKTGSGIGGGVAVPHAYLEELKTMIVAFVRIPDGLDFDATDGKPVNLAVALLGPRSAENLHLRLLARIAKLLSYKSFRNRLLEASGPAEIISIFREAESGIP
jgi:PTS system nitrogen regulatory IIA component